MADTQPSKLRRDFRPDSGTLSNYHLAGSATILCTGRADVIQKGAWPFYRTISGVRLCWELEEPKGPKGPLPHR